MPWDTERFGAKCWKMYPAKKSSKDLAVSASIAFYLFKMKQKITALGVTGHLSALIAPSYWPFQHDYRNPLVERKLLQFHKSSDLVAWYHSNNICRQFFFFLLYLTWIIPVHPSFSNIYNEVIEVMHRLSTLMREERRRTHICSRWS